MLDWIADWHRNQRDRFTIFAAVLRNQRQVPRQSLVLPIELPIFPAQSLVPLRCPRQPRPLFHRRRRIHVRRNRGRPAEPRNSRSRRWDNILHRCSPKSRRNKPRSAGCSSHRHDHHRRRIYHIDREGTK